MLNRQRRDAEQFGIDLGQIQKLNALRRRAQTRARPDRNPAEQTAAFRLVVIFYIQKMPVCLAFVGENEERVRMLAQQLRDYRTLESAREGVRREPAIDDVVSIVLATTCEQHGVIRQRLARRFLPRTPGKRLVHALVIEFRPKELLQRFDAPQPFQQVQNVLLSFGS